jgi:hypothetical protein
MKAIADAVPPLPHLQESVLHDRVAVPGRSQEAEAPFEEICAITYEEPLVCIYTLMCMSV